MFQRDEQEMEGDKCQVLNADACSISSSLDEQRIRNEKESEKYSGEKLQ